MPEVLFKMRMVGKTLRIVTIDPIKRIEVSMVAPAKANKNDSQRVAARKLAYVISKKKTAETRLIYWYQASFRPSPIFLAKSERRLA